MDVRCDKCGTEYEFDDARVGAHGVTVKCTACGYVFKVHRPRPSNIEPGKEWLVRRPDSQIIAFRELTTLQKWIVEGRIGREDEISKNGETWKRLGNISELEPFFIVYEKARALNDLMTTGAIGERPITVNGSEVLATMSPLSSSMIASAESPPSAPERQISNSVSAAAPGGSSAQSRANARSGGGTNRSAGTGRPERSRGPSLVSRTRPGDAPAPPDPRIPTVSAPEEVATLPEDALTNAPTESAKTVRPRPEPRPASLPGGRANGASPPPSRPKPPFAAPPAFESYGDEKIEDLNLAGPAALERPSVDPGPGPSALGPVPRPGSLQGEDLVKRFEHEQRIRKVLVWMAAVIGLGLLIGGGLFAVMGPEQNPVRELATRFGLFGDRAAKGDPAQAHIEAAQAAFELDTAASLEAAGKELDQALELRPNEPTLRADRALIMSTQADALRRWATEQDAAATNAEKRQKDYELALEKVKALPEGELVKGPEKPPAVDLAALRKDAEDKRSAASAIMKKAFELARNAYVAVPNELSASRALADYYRVQRDARVMQLLSQAKAAAQSRGTSDAATIYVEAAATVNDPDEASPAQLEQASRLLDEALTLRPSLLRARVMLARILIARRLPALAKTELERVLKSSPQHEEAKRLMSKAGAAASAAVNAPPAATGSSGASAPEASAKPAPAPTPAAAPTPTPSPSPSSASASTDKPKTPRPKPEPSPAASPTPPSAPSGASAATGASGDAPKDVTGWIKEGDRLREQGKPWKALLSYEKAADKKPGAARAYTGMGWCYLDLGKPVAALTQFRKAAQVDEHFGEAVFGRAEAHRAMGQKDDAIAAYREYLKVEPGGADANAAKRAIASLEKGE